MNKKKQIYSQKDFDKALEMANMYNINLKKISRSRERYLNITQRSSDIYKRMNDTFQHFYKKNVLDLGCNMGVLSIMISSFANEVHAIDVEKEYIYKGKRLKHRLGVKNIDIIVKDILEIDEKFLDSRNINAVFFNRIATYSWKSKDFKRIFDMLKDRCSIVVTNEKGKVRSFLIKRGYKMKLTPWYNKTINMYIK
jgi:predicted RNA methylase